MTLKKVPQLEYSEKQNTVSIRGMDTGAWAYAAYIAKLNKLSMAQLIVKLLEYVDEADFSNE